MRQDTTNIAIIGAGPYGLSVAAHLAAKNVDYRIFGTAMHTWKTAMPEGMLLRSEGFASNLSDPAGDHTLAKYSAQQGIAVGGWAEPVPLDAYCDYGEWFIDRLALPVEDKQLERLTPSDGGFDLSFAQGETVHARRVVIAVGLTHFERMPDELAHLPRGLCAHSSHPLELREHAGKDVVVVGAGQSALETAAILHEHDANVRVIARGSALNWHPDPPKRERPITEKLKQPVGGLGIGWRCVVFEHGAPLYRRLPASKRVEVVGRTFGPAGAWWLRERVVGHIPVDLERSLRTGRVDGDRVVLELDGPDGVETVSCDHVIAATGYRVDVRRLPFLAAELRDEVRVSAASPPLSSDFESSVPGLHFVGAMAAATFGPLMLFVLGARFTAHRIAPTLAR
jgi:hypothetical protein